MSYGKNSARMNITSRCDMFAVQKITSKQLVDIRHFGMLEMRFTWHDVSISTLSSLLLQRSKGYVRELHLSAVVTFSNLYFVGK
jgi:hypothetical protein